MQTSAPLPSVSARIASIGSLSRELIVCVAPKSRAISSFRSSRSTAITVFAPARRAPAMAALPTPPHPKTATESPRPTSPVNIAAPSPAITPQPRSPAASGRARGVDLRGLARGDERLLGERADAERGGERGAVGERHLLRGVEGGEAVPRAAPRDTPGTCRTPPASSGSRSRRARGRARRARRTRPCPPPRARAGTGSRR